MGSDVSVCKKCRKTVRWAAHERTKGLAPIDVEKIPGGNVDISWDNVNERWVYAVLNPEPTRVAYTNHFATCPSAKSFRK